MNSKGVFNRCSLPRLVVESGKRDKQANPSKDVEIPEWQRWKNPKRNDNYKNLRPSKKIKLDPRGDNPRFEGLVKRKPALDSLEEFQRECKRIRPDFEPEVECGENSEGQELLAKTTSNPKPTQNLPKILTENSTLKRGLFSIFTKKCSNEKEEEKQLPKRKSKTKPKPSSKLGDCKQGGVDIRKYLTKPRSLGSLEVVSQRSSKHDRKLGGDYKKDENKLHNTVSEVGGELNQISSNLDSIRAGECEVNIQGTST